MAAKAGRFYEIRKQLGDKPYELTDDIHIPPMDLERREAWRKASYRSQAEPYLQARALADGKEREVVNHGDDIAKALLGDHFDTVKELCRGDARLWDAVLEEVKEFNKIDGTASEASADAAAEGNASATPA